MEPFKYCKSLLHTSQCSVVGEDKSWLSLFTDNAISGLVRVTYCKAPIIHLYWDALEIVGPDPLLRWCPVDIGVGIGLYILLEKDKIQ